MNNQLPHFARFLWEMDVSRYDFIEGYRLVTERVAERGNDQDWQELVYSYGEWQVRYTLMNEAIFWHDETIDAISNKLNCPKEHLYCYHHAARRIRLLEMLPKVNTGPLG